MGDLIVAVDDATVTDFASLRSELAKHQVGDRVTLQLLRSDNRQRQGQLSERDGHAEGADRRLMRLKKRY